MKRECEVVEVTAHGSPAWAHVRLTYKQEVQGDTHTRELTVTLNQHEWPKDAPHDWPPVQGDKIVMDILPTA